MQNHRWSPYAEIAVNSKKYDCYSNVVTEIIYGRLYFLTAVSTPRSTQETHFFTVDDELVYERYYDDFGPLNLGHLYRFCCKLNKKFKSASLNKKKIVFYTAGNQPEKRANAAFLIGAYQVIYLKKTPEEAFVPLAQEGPIFKPFRDASYGESVYDLTVLDCLKGLAKAIANGFVDFSKFNLVEYEHHMRIDRGDLTWIVPSKIIAFSCPQEDSRSTINGIRMFTPVDYVPIFKQYHVTDVVRLNKAVYDRRQFVRAGIRHHDLYFPDGTTPSDDILKRFLHICETAGGAIAVHCKAGLGRTGSLIGCYIMKHHRFSCQEAIAWLRICRPGSVIGMQQMWMDEKQAWCWMQGDMHRRRKNSGSSLTSHRRSIVYSPEADNGLHREGDKTRPRAHARSDSVGWNGYGETTTNGYLDEATEITQGDRLNHLKMRRSTEGKSITDSENSVPRRNSRTTHSEGKARARSSSPASNGQSASIQRSGSASSLRGSTKDLSNAGAPRRSSSTYTLSSTHRDTTDSTSARRSNGRFVLSNPTRSSAAPAFSSSMGKKPPIPSVSHSISSRSTTGNPGRRSTSVTTVRQRTPLSTYTPYGNAREQTASKGSVTSSNPPAADDPYMDNEVRKYSASTFPRSKSAKIRRSPSRDSLGVNGASSHHRTSTSRAKSANFMDGGVSNSRQFRTYQADKSLDSRNNYLSKSYGDLLHAYNYERSSPSRYSNAVNGYGALRSSYSFY